MGNSKVKKIVESEIFSYALPILNDNSWLAKDYFKDRLLMSVKIV